MPRNSSGTYTVPSGTTATNGQVISSTAYNAFLTDMSSALSTSINTAGTATMSGALNMGSQKITNVATPSAGTDAANKSYVLTAAAQTTAPAGRNRLTNGTFIIDQRYGGSGSTPSSTALICDRWSLVIGSMANVFEAGALQVGGAAGSPAAEYCMEFQQSIQHTPVAAGDYAILQQQVEALDIQDFGWGTVSAQSVTLSFWVNSSSSGTYGGSLSAATGSARSYPFKFTISSPNVWQYITVTIGGDSGGNWLTSATNLNVNIALVCGTTKSGTQGSWSSNLYYNATSSVGGQALVTGGSGGLFQITNVQLEAGTVATGYNIMPYAVELARCQRHYETSLSTNLQTLLNSPPVTLGQVAFQISAGLSSAQPLVNIPVGFNAQKATAPTVVVYSPNTATAAKAYDVSGTTDVTGSATNIATTGFTLTGTPSAARTNINLAWHWAASTGI